MKPDDQPVIDRDPFAVEEAFQANRPSAAPATTNVVVLPQPTVPPPALARSTVPHFSMAEMTAVATAIAKGGLFGSKDVNAVLTLCMLAHAEGQHPAVIFRDYNIIQGRPAKKAEAMQRDFLRAGGRIEWHRLDDQVADATFSHPYGGSARIEWSIDRAKLAGLFERKNRDGSDGMWKKYPRAMLRCRCLSEGVRTIWPDATSGVYEVNEMMDIVQDEAERHEAEKRARRENAEIFANAQLEAVADTKDDVDLDMLIQEANREVRKLARTHADLYQSIQTAYETRKLEFQGYDPTTGLTKEQAEAQAAQPNAEPVDANDLYSTFERRLDEAQDMAAVGRIDADWVKVRAAADDETQGLIDDAIGRARRRFRK